MSHIINKTRYVSIAFLVIAAVVLGWTGGSALAGDKMEKKPMAAKEMAQKPAVIHFVDIAGVKDWRAEGLNTILIQGNNNQWYRATFFSECYGAPWAQHIAFVTSPDGSLNKFSSVLINGQQCYFKDVKKIPNPDTTKSKESEKKN
jgi:hypothetical protein